MPHRLRRLYLVRHAIAEERGPKWPDDAVRPLTAGGMDRMRRVVAGLAGLDEPLSLILTSPFLRASQTAELLSDGLPKHPPVLPLPALAPGGSPQRTVKAFSATARDVNAVALVGHEPDLGELASWVLGMPTPLTFKKGGICRIDVETWPPRGHGQLVWFATPRMLRKVI